SSLGIQRARATGINDFFAGTTSRITATTPSASPLSRKNRCVSLVGENVCASPLYVENNGRTNGFAISAAAIAVACSPPIQRLPANRQNRPAIVAENADRIGSNSETSCTPSWIGSFCRIGGTTSTQK